MPREKLTERQREELEIAVDAGGAAYTTTDPNDMASPILLELVSLGLMERRGNTIKLIVTPAGRAALEAE